MANPNKNRGNFIITEKGVAPIHGIELFKKNLERLFFASCTVWCQKIDGKNTVDLFLELDCNFGLTQSLFHLNNGDWGGFAKCPKRMSKFDECIFDITRVNSYDIDIGELTFNFADTSIVISKLFPRSITCCLESILTAISANFVYFTKGVTEMPYEIFVPVFADRHFSVMGDIYEDPEALMNNYFDFWGLYFSTKEPLSGATIYDVKNKRISEGDFLVLDF